ncbi:BamA/TamA family outer membrane protein [candidate division TA06 bacterium]|nr:BamA/TamA family outer membrane protein [candidate division TA06 bacterium]
MTSISSSEEEGGKPIIRKITILRDNVFSSTDNPIGIARPIVNKLHITTRESIIRQELLFQEGDTLDEDLIQETERNLRRLNYLESAQVTYEENPEGSVDVTVHTHDSWSTSIGITLSRQENRTDYGLLFEEFNLLGYGKKLNASWNRREEGDSGEISYTENRIFGSRWTVGGTANRGPVGSYRYTLNSERPFYSLDTKWAANLRVNSEKTIINPNTESEFTNISNSQKITISRALGERFAKIITSTGYLHLDASSGNSRETVNEISTSIRLRSFRFAKTQRIDKFERIEDIELGNSLGVGIGRAGKPFGEGRDFWRYVADQSARISVGTKAYVLERLNYTTTRESGNWVNRITQLEFKGYYQKLPSQTLALRVIGSKRRNLVFGKELIILDESSGLRGYASSDNITGEKTLLLNVEDRIFTDIKFLTVALGGVLFLDGGGAWGKGESIQLSDMKYSAGFGFRFGLTKSASSRVGRLDFAIPLEGKGTQFKNIVVSFGSDQIFSLN